MLLTALLLRRDMCFVVPLDTVKELLPALRVPDVLNTDVHPLLDVTVADDLVDDDANGAGSNIVDDTSPARGEDQWSKEETPIYVRETHPW